MANNDSYLLIPRSGNRPPKVVRIPARATSSTSTRSNTTIVPSPLDPTIKVPTTYIAVKGKNMRDLSDLAANPPAHVRQPAKAVVWIAIWTLFTAGAATYVALGNPGVWGQIIFTALSLVFFIDLTELRKRIRNVPRARRFAQARTNNDIVVVSPHIMQALIKKARSLGITLSTRDYRQMVQAQFGVVQNLQDRVIPTFELRADPDVEVVVAGRARFAEDVDTIFFNGTKDERMARNAGNLQFLRDGTES